MPHQSIHQLQKLLARYRYLIFVVVVAVSLVSIPYFSGVSLTPLPRNVVLFYDDYPQRGVPAFQIRSSTVDPLIAYFDESGKPSGFLFDGIILYNLWLGAALFPTQQVVRSYMSYLFNGSQVANLDNEVGFIKHQLGAESNYKLSVFLSVPVVYPNGTAYVPNFGRYVNVATVKHNIDILLAAWAKLAPTNLSLIGFYWGFTEDVRDQIDTLIQNGVAPYVHGKGLKLLMIPCCITVTSWSLIHSLGVDLVTGQPNFMEDQTSNKTRFTVVNAQLQAGNIDGVELEIAPSGDPINCCHGNAILNAQTYYHYALQYQWYRNRMNTYYYGPALSMMATGTDWGLGLRSIYDLTYQFIQATRTGVATQSLTNTFSSASTITGTVATSLTCPIIDAQANNIPKGRDTDS